MWADVCTMTSPSYSWFLNFLKLKKRRSEEFRCMHCGEIIQHYKIIFSNMSLIIISESDDDDDDYYETDALEEIHSSIVNNDLDQVSCYWIFSAWMSYMSIKTRDVHFVFLCRQISVVAIWFKTDYRFSLVFIKCIIQCKVFYVLYIVTYVHAGGEKMG